MPFILERESQTMRRRHPRGLFGVTMSAALLLIVSASESIAQEGDEPLRLIPSQQGEASDVDGPASGGDPAPVPEAVAAPASDADPVADGEEDDPSRPAAAASAESGIVVGTLEAIDPDAAGVPLPGIEPFPADFWSGSRRSRIEALLPRLPALATSPTMRRLTLTLLASAGEPPAGRGKAGALVLSRAERLAAMGARDHALALLERAGPGRRRRRG